MALTTFVAGTGIQSAPVNDNFALALNDSIITKIDQLIDRDVTRSNDKVSPFVEAYIDADGRKNSVVVADTGAIFDTNKYKAFDETVYDIIEATSISSASDFAINNCQISEFDTGKWVLFCTTGTDEVKRAQIRKTLYYGTDGSDPRASPTYITGITALRTSVARDIGKQAYYATANSTGTGTTTAWVMSYTATFANTTTNANCSSWSRLTAGGTSGNGTAAWEIPDGTVRHSISTATTSDEIGTDLSADENSNPATVDLRTSAASNSSAGARAIILCAGTMSWTANETAGSGTGSTSTSLLNFNTDNSIPVYTAIITDVISRVTHTILAGTFNSNVSNGVAAVKIVDWEDGASLQWKATNATEDTGWLGFNIDGDTAYAKISAFTAFTTEPTKFIVRLVPKVSSPTAGVPAINGAGVKLI